MILVTAAMVASLTALQATINVPREAFRNCMREATTAARSEKVKGDEFEAYMRSKCSVEIGSLRSAIQAFNVKNGMAKKAAASDADLTVDDYVASPVEKYKFMSTISGTEPEPSTPPTP